MKYSTINKHIRYWDKKALESRDGMQGYEESINALYSTEKLCHYTVMLLKKCQQDNIPFNEFEIKMKKDMEEVDLVERD